LCGNDGLQLGSYREQVLQSPPLRKTERLL
jgi:hypothetical protein